MNRACLTPVPVAALPPAIAEHELFRPIASGSYGEVWLARNAVGTRRAVKIVRRDRFERDEDFEREFRGLQRFEPVSRTHDALVDVLQIGRQDDWFYYVMGLADAAGNPKTEVRSSKGEVRAQEGGLAGFPRRQLELKLATTTNPVERAELFAKAGNPTNKSHLATNEAIGHSAATLGSPVESRWFSTSEAAAPGGQHRLRGVSGLWIAPASRCFE